MEATAATADPIILQIYRSLMFVYVTNRSLNHLNIESAYTQSVDHIAGSVYLHFNQLDRWHYSFTGSSACTFQLFVGSRHVYRKPNCVIFNLFRTRVQVTILAIQYRPIYYGLESHERPFHALRNSHCALAISYIPALADIPFRAHLYCITVINSH